MFERNRNPIASSHFHRNKNVSVTSNIRIAPWHISFHPLCSIERNTQRSRSGWNHRPRIQFSLAARPKTKSTATTAILCRATKYAKLAPKSVSISYGIYYVNKYHCLSAFSTHTHSVSFSALCKSHSRQCAPQPLFGPLPPCIIYPNTTQLAICVE